MIEEFGKTVEAIEDNCFEAPPVEKLFKKEEGERNIFAHKVCRKCDGFFPVIHSENMCDRVVVVVKS